MDTGTTSTRGASSRAGDASAGAVTSRPAGRAAAAVVVLLLAVVACSSAAAPAVVEPEQPRPTPLCGPAPAGVEMNSVGTFGRQATPVRRVVLMGGASEVDAASRRFVEGAAGGDVLILRASGSTTSYNGYFATQVGAAPSPASVTSIRIDDPAAGSHATVLCRVAHAEAVWLAGGDQWNYLGHWPAALHDSLAALHRRAAAVGGTSAGAMSLSEVAYDARTGSATSEQALADPFHAAVTVSRSPFGQPELHGMLVDTHFMQRTREGRLLAFLARGRMLLQRDAMVGVGLDERVAMIIEGGRYAVMTGAADRYAWVYRVSGGGTVQQGTPLSLESVERVRLSDGATGAWPLDLAGHVVERLRVVDGAVTPPVPSPVPGTRIP
jgi:cyanophycinase